MKNFTFKNSTKIIFGRESWKKLGEETGKHGKKVLLHYGSGSIKRNGVYEKVVSQLEDAGVDFVELSGVKPNPRLSMVYKGIEICKKEGIDFILAVGGGSVIDSAKAIGSGVAGDTDIWEMFEKGLRVEKTLPVGVVLTNPAAGSESSTSMVITNEDGWFKKGLGSDVLRPVFAIMDPEFTFTLPAYTTVCGVSDMMAHIMERYFTNVKNVDLTDRLCEGTLKSIIDNAPVIVENPEDYDARAEIMWAGTIAHNDLLGTGRVGDWASHGIEHELSAIYDIAHGAGLAVIFPAWMKYVYKHDVERFAQFSVRVWNNDYDFDNPEVTALAGIRSMENFFKSIGLPTTLKELDIDDSRLDEMAEKCVGDGTTGSFVKLDREDVKNIVSVKSFGDLYKFL